MLRKFLLITVAVLGLLAAPAAAQYSFVVEPGEVLPGTTIDISGEGCRSGEDVEITLTDADGETITLTETQADDEGDVAAQAVIPEDIDPGEYTVSMVCGEHVMSKTITVLDPDADDTTTTTAVGTTPAPGTGGGGGGTLATTGSDLNAYVLAGAAMLAVGGVFLIATRRHRRTA